jgi:hypothetical protein
MPDVPHGAATLKEVRLLRLTFAPRPTHLPPRCPGLTVHDREVDWMMRAVTTPESNADDGAQEAPHLRCEFARQCWSNLVDPRGIKPRTRGLKGGRSTANRASTSNYENGVGHKSAPTAPRD